MRLLTLILYLTTGQMIHEPITPADCSMLLQVATEVAQDGGVLERPEGYVAALECNGQAVVLALPTTNGDCETGETT